MARIRAVYPHLETNTGLLREFTATTQSFKHALDADDLVRATDSFLRTAGTYPDLTAWSNELKAARRAKGGTPATTQRCPVDGDCRPTWSTTLIPRHTHCLTHNVAWPTTITEQEAA